MVRDACRRFPACFRERSALRAPAPSLSAPRQALRNMRDPSPLDELFEAVISMARAGLHGAERPDDAKSGLTGWLVRYDGPNQHTVNRCPDCCMPRGHRDGSERGAMWMSRGRVRLTCTHRSEWITYGLAPFSMGWISSLLQTSF